MTRSSRVVHTGNTRTTGGRENGISRSSDGRLDVRLAAPGSDRIGTNPENLFAAAWSACFETGILSAAKRRGISLPLGVTIDAEVDLNAAENGHFLSARFNVFMPGVSLATAESLICEADGSCPYSKATRGNIDLAITLVE
ncbi:MULTISPECIES: Ohr family peroxiredoxin [unclassified Bradyrhizobium]|uniref:Ohr family peroxiredoxin n=1 Tax=unclassified Bradyrhizobium TaxID=2631580 RepID=UPI001FF784A7|nr:MULTISPECIES: Ohr family peroxiredoxin [unclassified Bradyrhizobium]MCK1537524.1 Ohr family peroxiredoxin [Bradyrhizobium sp. 176]MCK1554912.1 Ohr family peroxiredoxin [Bradyrhizobium sp. 171]UPJ28922.1 Ohr family peroxiredoxin [Bradyrhizobium sp. CW1]